MKKLSVISWHQLLVITLVLFPVTTSCNTLVAVNTRRRGILRSLNNDGIRDSGRQLTHSIPSYLAVRGGISSNTTPSKSACWIALFSAILSDTFSTTMMKVASDEKSVSKLCLAYCGYFLR
jgi:hypothetical protein